MGCVNNFRKETKGNANFTICSFKPSANSPENPVFLCPFQIV